MLIYLITNDVNDKVYVGQTTKSLEERIKNHRNSMVSGGTTHLYNAMRKYGWDKFHFHTIAYADDQETLNELEEYFIKKYDSTNHRIGYNILPGTSYRFASGAPMKNPEIAKRVTDKLRGRKGAKRSEESKKNMRVAAKKSWENADSRRQNISNIMKTYMENGGREHLSLVKRGKVFTDEHKCNIFKEKSIFDIFK